jgi:DNA-binding transcriptional LysR family regulator
LPDRRALDVVEFRPLSIALPALEGRIVRQPSQIFESGHDAVLADGRLVSLMPGYKPVESELSVICPPGKNLSAKVRSLIDFLAARFGPEPPRDEWDTTERTKKSRARRR